jgi:hypothetical protein
MPELLTLSNAGVKGINSDIKPWELEPEFITSGANFRIFAGAIRASGGSEVWSLGSLSNPVVDEFDNIVIDEFGNTLVDQITATFNPGFLIPVAAVSADYWIAAGRSDVKVFDGATWTSIASAAGYASLGTDDELNWTGCKLGSIPIINNPQASPEYWSPQSPGQILQPLPFDASNTWLAKGYSFNCIRSHKNFLFALNLTEGGVELPNSYRWSTAADINGLPFTWDETDLSGLAGKAQLGGDAGTIIDGLSLRDAFAIYSENAITMLDFTGDEFVWRARDLSSTIGLLAKDCVVEVKGTHFFLSDGDIVKNDGNKIDSIIHNRLRRRLSSSISEEYFTNSFVVKNNALKEVWFCVPDDGAILPNIAYIYNWKDDSWAIRDLPEATAFAAYGSQAPATTTWNDWGGSWEEQSTVWGSRKITPLDDTIIGVNSASSALIMLDPSIPNTDLNTRIERTDFPLEGHRQVTTITRLYPHIEGAGSLNISVGSQDYAGAPIRWSPPSEFTPGVDRKIDVRTTGELHCWRMESIGTISFDFSGMDIEYAKNGQR